MTTPLAPVAWLPQADSTVSISVEPRATAQMDFSPLLKSGANQLTEQTGRANELLSSYALGENVSPHELVMAMEQAKLSMQLAVEVRNKLVDAYQELTRLQI